MKNKYSTMKKGLLITLLIFSLLPFVTAEVLQNDTDFCDATKSCSVNDECVLTGHEKNHMLMSECRAKNITGRCIKGGCCYIIDRYPLDENKMIELAENEIINYVGKDYFQEHYSLRNVTRVNFLYHHGTVEYDMSFGELSYTAMVMIDFPCEVGGDYELIKVSGVLEPIEITVNQEEALQIAEKRGVQSPFKVSGVFSPTDQKQKEGVTNLKPSWVVTTNSSECEDFAAVRIDAVSGDTETGHINPCSAPGFSKKTAMPEILGQEQIDPYLIAVIVAFLVILALGFLYLRKK
jgi:hypothetical protein